MRTAALALCLALLWTAALSHAAQPGRQQLSAETGWEEAVEETGVPVFTVVGPDQTDRSEMSADEIERNAAVMERLGYFVAVPVRERDVLVSPTEFARVAREAVTERRGDEAASVAAVPPPPTAVPEPGPPVIFALPQAIPGVERLIATHELVEPGQDASPAAYHVLLVARRGAAEKVDAAGRVVCNLGPPSSVGEPERRAILAVPVTKEPQGALSEAYDFERVANWNGLLAALSVPVADRDLLGFLALEEAASPVGMLDRGTRSAFQAARPIFVDLSDLSIHYVETVTEKVVSGMAEGRADSHLTLLALMNAISEVHLLGEALVAIVGSDTAVAGERPPPC